MIPSTPSRLVFTPAARSSKKLGFEKKKKVGRACHLQEYHTVLLSSASGNEGRLIIVTMASKVASIESKESRFHMLWYVDAFIPIAVKNRNSGAELSGWRN